MKPFVNKKSIIIHQIDLKEKKWVAFNQESPNESHIIGLEKMDVEKGLRFASTLCSIDYVHIRRFIEYPESHQFIQNNYLIPFAFEEEDNFSSFELNIFVKSDKKEKTKTKTTDKINPSCFVF